MTARYDPDHIGVGRMLRAPFMEKAMVSVAERIRARAEAAAPVSHDAKDPHRGRYKASFHVRSHTHGGATNDRAEAIVFNDSPEAYWVEFGHRGREPIHILRLAAFRRLR